MWSQFFLYALIFLFPKCLGCHLPVYLYWENSDHVNKKQHYPVDINGNLCTIWDTVAAFDKYLATWGSRYINYCAGQVSWKNKAKSLTKTQILAKSQHVLTKTWCLQWVGLVLSIQRTGFSSVTCPSGWQCHHLQNKSTAWNQEEWRWMCRQFHR